MLSVHFSKEATIASGIEKGVTASCFGSFAVQNLEKSKLLAFFDMFSHRYFQCTRFSPTTKTWATFSKLKAVFHVFWKNNWSRSFCSKMNLMMETGGIYRFTLCLLRMIFPIWSQTFAPSVHQVSNVKLKIWPVPIDCSSAFRQLPVEPFK